VYVSKTKTTRDAPRQLYDCDGHESAEGVGWGMDDDDDDDDDDARAGTDSKLQTDESFVF
jgi:hypothetical protein